MQSLILAEHILNGLQYGLILFLTASGLTLVFGILGFVNLNHGTLYMVAALTSAKVYSVTQSFLAAGVLGIAAPILLGLLLYYTLYYRLAERTHLDQVLGTFAVILIINELSRIYFGRQPYQVPPPGVFEGAVHIWGDLYYPRFKLFVLAASTVVSLALWYVIAKTRLGMLVRAGATQLEVVEALGVNIKWLNLSVFALGFALAGVAGVLTAPLQAVEIGMGEQALVVMLVALVVGGVGSIRGCLVACLIIGFLDVAGKAVVPIMLQGFLTPDVVASISGLLSSTTVYVMLIAALLFKPNGMFSKV